MECGLRTLPWSRQRTRGASATEQHLEPGANGLRGRQRHLHPMPIALEKLGFLSMLMSFSADGDDAVEFRRAASELVASKATMVLSEARGLW
jgi:hypothetical protein